MVGTYAYEIIFILFVIPLPVIIGILVAVKSPFGREILGMIFIIFGIVNIITLSWLFGVGLMIGIPSLILGISLVIWGLRSRKNQEMK